MLAFDLKGHGGLHLFHSTSLGFFLLRYDIASLYNTTKHMFKTRRIFYAKT